MRLWLKLALAMVAVSLAPLAVVSLQVLDLTSDQAADARQAARQREAAAVADEVARWTESKAQAVHGFTGLYPDLLERPLRVQDGVLKLVYRAVPGAVTVALLDEDGLAGRPGRELPPRWLDTSLTPEDPLASRPRGSRVRADTFLERVPRPTEPRQVLVGAPYFPPPATLGAPEPGPSIAIGARGPYAEPAVLAVEVSLDELEGILSRHALDERGVQLVLSDGTQIIRKGTSVDLAPLAPLLGGTKAVFVDEDTARVGALAPVPRLGWTIVISEPTAIDPAWPMLRFRLLLALGLSLVVAVLTGILVARTVSRPIAVVRDAANRVADGDLRHRVPATARDEIGELAASFNHMAGRLSGTLAELESRRAEVEAFNEELQDRVDARTRELQAAQEELLRAGQLAAVGEVGAGLAHELNNPLASVLGLLQVARSRTADPKERALLQQAETEAQRCREVVAAMVQLSSEEAGERGGRAEFGPALDEVARLVEVAARARGVGLTAELPEAEAEDVVAMDGTALRRVLTQVLQGLVAGLPDGASLAVHLDRTDADSLGVVLTPSEGVAAGARRDDYRAAGLGLWTARRLIAASGGRLDAPDDAEGAWRLVLPRA